MFHSEHSVKEELFKLLVTLQVISMANILTFFGCSNMDHSLLMLTTSFLVTMWIEGSSPWRLFVFSWPTRSSTQRTSFFSEGTMNVLVSTGYMDSMMNVSQRKHDLMRVRCLFSVQQAREDTTLNCGRPSLTASTVFQLLLL